MLRGSHFLVFLKQLALLSAECATVSGLLEAFVGGKSGNGSRNLLLISLLISDDIFIDTNPR